MVVYYYSDIVWVFDIGCSLVGIFRNKECNHQRRAVRSILVK